MDFDNNGQDMTNFMHKVKKQAKRLFQLSKTRSNNLEINSLSKAQEILAQINGYPDWHAFEKTVASRKSVLTKEENSPYLQLQQLDNFYGNLYFLETEEYITTFLRANSVPATISSIQEKMLNFNNMFSFEINMNLHDVSVVIDQKNKFLKNDSGYNLYNISQSFDLTEEQAKSLFLIDKSVFSPIDDNDLTIYIIVTSSIKNKNQHINLCLSMISNYYSQLQLESMPKIDQQTLAYFQLEQGKTDEKLYESLFVTKNPSKNSEENIKKLITKWVYLLNFLVDKKISFILKYSLTNQTCKFNFSDYEKNKDLIDNFINSAIKTVSFSEQTLKYISKPSFNYIENKENEGLSLKSQITGQIFNYNDNSNIRSHHIDLIYGKPGSGKSILNNMIVLSSILNKKPNTIPNIAIIDVGSSYAGMIQLLKNIFPVEIKHQVQQFDMENSDKYSINPFDLQLGKRIYDYNDCRRISNILLNLFEKNESLQKLLCLAIEHFNYSPHKNYTKGVDIHIDKALQKLNVNIHHTTTWWEIVDILFINDLPDLALKAQRWATPTLADLPSILQSDKINNMYKNIKVSTGETLIQYVNRILLDTLTIYPFLTNKTNFELGNTKIAYFNLDKVCNIKNRFTNILIQDYWFSLILNLSTYTLMGMNNYDYSGLDYKWRDSWQSYLKTEDISKVYQYYNEKKIGSRFIANKLIIDEFHRFSHSQNNVEQLTMTVREGRKYNTSVSVCTQTLNDINYIIDYTTSFFVSNYSDKDSKILEDYGFEKNELDMLKKVKFPNWAVKIKTNRGKIFDVVKLKMPDMLKFALSTTSEDVLIRNETIKKYGYFTALEKCSKYLTIKNIKYHSFKIIFEQKREQNISLDDIVKNIIQEIK